MFRMLSFYLIISGGLANLIYAIPLIGERVEDAMMDEFPFIASLQTKIPYNHLGEKHFCTGSLITARDVLTATHCIEDLQPDGIQVVLGVFDLIIDHPKYNVSWMVTYNKWTLWFNLIKKFQDNDIAIVRLSTEVSSRYIKPVIIGALPTAHLYRTKAVILGWGVLINSTKKADRLRKAKVDIYTPEVCQRQIYLLSNRRVTVERNNLCTAAQPFTLMNCGDSGGPLLDKDNNLLGVSSGSCIKSSLRWGNFSKELTDKFEVNMHFSIEYYRQFMQSVVHMSVEL